MRIEYGGGGDVILIQGDGWVFFFDLMCGTSGSLSYSYCVLISGGVVGFIWTLGGGVLIMADLEKVGHTASKVHAQGQLSEF